MHIAYRVGWPFWKLAARLKLPLFVRVSVLWDNEAKVFVAESEDFLPRFACVAEAETLEKLEQELGYIFEEALTDALGKQNRKPEVRPVLRLAA